MLLRDRTMQKQEYFQTMHLGLLWMVERSGFRLLEGIKGLSSGANKLLI